MICKTLFTSLGALALLLTTACGDAGTGEDGSTTTPMTSDATQTTGDTPTTGTPVECDVCGKYGAAVPTVAANITDKAAADPMFMADFAALVAEGTPAVDAFKLSLANFISDAYKCSTGLYTGPTMEAAHTGLAITQAEYDAFIGLIVEVLTEADVPGDEITACFAPTLTDPAFAATIIGK